MDNIREELHRVLTKEKLDEIIELTDQVMDDNYKAISARASGMADVRTYLSLIHI